MAYQVVVTLTLPNMVLVIPVWYLDPPYMVPIPTLPPQTIALPMKIRVNPLFPQLGHTIGRKNTNTRGKKKKIGGNT
jgi:hypothetical protein